VTSSYSPLGRGFLSTISDGRGGKKEPKKPGSTKRYNSLLFNHEGRREVEISLLESMAMEGGRLFLIPEGKGGKGKVFPYTGNKKERRFQFSWESWKRRVGGLEET